MRLRKHRYHAIIELTKDETAHDVLDEWQTLYTPPEGGAPYDMELQMWRPLVERPSVPEQPTKPNRSIRIWRSTRL